MTRHTTMSKNGLRESGFRLTATCAHAMRALFGWKKALEGDSSFARLAEGGGNDGGGRGLLWVCSVQTCVIRVKSKVMELFHLTDQRKTKIKSQVHPMSLHDTSVSQL